MIKSTAFVTMARKNDVHVDAILEDLGPLGRFTCLQLFLIWLGGVPCGLQLLSNVFIGGTNPHQCAKFANESELMSGFESQENVSVVYGQCEVLVMSGDRSLHTQPCKAMDYEMPVSQSFVSQFDLVCDSTNLARLTQTLVIGGQGTGAMLGSLLADKIGRRPVFLTANIGLMVAGIVVAYAPNYHVFAFAKFIVGAFQNASVSIMSTLIVESMTMKYRQLAAICGGIFWASGSILLDLIAYLMKDYSWRDLQLALSLCSLPVLLQCVFLKESLRWMIANGKTKSSIAHIKYVARMNGKNADEVLKHMAEEIVVSNSLTDNVVPMADGHNDVTEVGEIVITSNARKLSYLDFFRFRRLLVNTLIMWTAWFTTAFGFFAIYLTATSLAGDRYLNFFLTALMEIPTNFFYFGLNRFGRKRILRFVFVLLSIGLIAGGAFRSLTPSPAVTAMAVVSSMVAMMGASGCFTLCFSYTPELFPTNIRNQAVGISSMMARIGGMLAPFTGLLSEKAKWGPGVLIGGLASIVAILLRYVPETNGRELPQTLEELQAWYKDSNKKEKNGKEPENNIR